MATTLAPARQQVGIDALVASLAGSPGPVIAARLRGVDVHCVLELDRGEHERRQAAGVGAISDRHVLNALMELVPGVEVSRASLSGSARRALRREAAEATTAGSRTVARLAQPPLSVPLVVVQGTRWARGVDRASRFGPYCARVLSLSRLPADAAELLLEASYLGVGVACPDNPRVVPFAPFTPMRFTASSWAFAEAAYAQFLDQTSSTAGNCTLVETLPSSS
jgi:hypothetical protein